MVGLAVWLSIIVINNIQNFTGGAFSVGQMMSMRLFEEPPVIETPLLSRKVTSQSWHRLVLGLVIGLEILVAAALWRAAYMMLVTASGSTGAIAGADAANLALAGFLGLIFIMSWGGAWFAYYIKQETAQVTHFLLLGVGLAAIVVVNLPQS